MTTHVLFVQGAGKDAHDRWDSKLAASLAQSLGDGYDVRFPKMPGEADPHFAQWQAALEREFEALGDGDILVGHSVGATTLLHTLAAKAPSFKPGALILLAPPFIGEEGWPSQDITPRRDFGSSLPTAMPVRLYHGTDDATVPFVHTRLYAEAMPQAQIVPMPGGDHQFHDDLGRVAHDIRALDKG